MKNKISLFQLTILIVSTIASIRTLPTTATFGTSLVFFYIFAAILFLIPIAYISAEFTSRYSDEGGIFHWVQFAFGKKIAMLAVWLQWINTMVWYPTMLLFVAGTASYLIDPSLAQNNYFLLFSSLVTFWGITILNLKGIKSSVNLNSFCGIAGTLIPILGLIFLGGYWIFAKNPLAISFSKSQWIPSLNLLDSTNALITIMASFLGMELAGVHVADIHNPRKNFPRAIGISVLVLLSTLGIGSLSIAFVIPAQNIHFVDGVMQTFSIFLTTCGIPFLIPILATLIIAGAIGGAVNWVLGPAKGLEQAGNQGFLPEFLLAKNQMGIPHRILILQAVVVSFFCYALYFVSSLNNYYWFLMALSTGLYMMMYILLFLAALKLKRPSNQSSTPFQLRTILCVFGLISCVITIVLGFQPAPNVFIKNDIVYVFTVAAGFILLLLPVFLFWKFEKNRSKRLDLENIEK